MIAKFYANRTMFLVSNNKKLFYYRNYLQTDKYIKLNKRVLKMIVTYIFCYSAEIFIQSFRSDTYILRLKNSETFF